MSKSLSKTQPSSTIVSCFSMWDVRFLFVNGFIQQPISSSDGSQDGSLFFDLDHTKRFAALYRIAWIPRGSRGLSMVGGRRRWMDGDLRTKSLVVITEKMNEACLKKSRGATYKNTSVFGGLWLDLTKSEYSKKGQNVAPLMLAPGTGNPKDWAATLNRFFTKTHREVPTCDVDVVWSWLQACELMMEEIQILWLFQCPFRSCG